MQYKSDRAYIDGDNTKETSNRFLYVIFPKTYKGFSSLKTQNYKKKVKNYGKKYLKKIGGKKYIKKLKP